MFAFFAAAVAVGGLDGVMQSLAGPVAIGIVLGLVVGKLVGIFGTAWLIDRFVPAVKDHDYTWLDLGGLAMVAGIGFTAFSLVAELSFGLGSPHEEHVEVGVLTGSAIAALVGGTLPAVRNTQYKKLQLAGVDVVKLDAA